MANAEQSKMFQEIFGLDPSKKVSDQIRRIQRVIVLAKLGEVARGLQPLLDKMAEVGRRYADLAPISSLDEAKSDLHEVTQLEEEIRVAESDFQISIHAAVDCGFHVSFRIEDFLPPVVEEQAK